MGCVLPLLALLGAAGGTNPLEERKGCGGTIEVSDAANGTIRLPSGKGPAAPNRTCTWVIAALPSEEVRLEIKALEPAARPNLSVGFGGSPGEGLSRKGPVDAAHGFLLTGKGRTVIRGRLDSSVTVAYWVAVDGCARLALCCSVQGLAQACRCPGNWTEERCRTGVAALQWPGSLQEGPGQVESQETTVKRRGPVLSGATEDPHSISDTAPAMRLSLVPRHSPMGQLAGTEESHGDVLRAAATVPQAAWLSRRKGDPGRTNPEPLVTAEPWDKTSQLDMLVRPTPTGQTGSALFSPKSQSKTATPTPVPIPGTDAVGNTKAKVATSPGGSDFQTESPTGVPGSATGEVTPWDWVTPSTSPGRAPVYTSGETALSPGSLVPRRVQMPGAAAAGVLGEPGEETSQGHAADALKPVTLLPPSALLSTGANGAQPFGGGVQGVGMAHRGSAVTADVALTELGVGARLPAPTMASGPNLSPGTIHTPASASGVALQVSQRPAQQPEGREGLTWQAGGRAVSQAQPGAETGWTSVRTPDSSVATTAHPVPGVQTTVGASTQHLVPLGAEGAGGGLDPTVAWAGSEQSPGPTSVDGFSGNMDFSIPNDTRTEGDPKAVSWAEPFTRASPAWVPSAHARTLWPFANLSAPTPSSGLVQPLLPVEQLSTLAGGSHPSARGQNGSLSERTQGPSLSTPVPALEHSSSDSQPLSWLPGSPPERTQGPGTGGSHSTVTTGSESAESVGTSSSPPVSSSLGALGMTVTSPEGVRPGASPHAPSSREAMLHSPGTLRATGAPAAQPPPASQTSQVDLQASTLQGGATALTLTETAVPTGPGLSSPSFSERDVPGSPPVLGRAELSMATTQSPAWATVDASDALATASAASWLGGTERLDQQAATSLAWSEPGNSSQDPDAPAWSRAGGSFSSSSTMALSSSTAPIPELIQTAGSMGPPNGSRHPQPHLQATPRVWGTGVTDSTSSARMNASFVSTQARAAMPPGTSAPAGATDVQPPPSTTKGARRRAQSVFIVEDQPPLLKVTILRLPCELALDMDFSPTFQSPTSHTWHSLVQSFNETVAPLFAIVPGFQRLEVKKIREGSVVLEYDALFAADQVRWQLQDLGALVNQTVQSGTAHTGLRIANATVLWNVVLESPLDLCAVIFSCQAGFECFSSGTGNASCTSVCHKDYCRNHGICTHSPDQLPVCQCPTGSDYWFMGLRCDYKVTQQSLLGVACGVLLTVALVGAAVAWLVIRRFKALLLEAKVDQTRSSYRRFCRLDDVSAPYWSQSWLASATSLDNPAFSNSEELLHLQMLDNNCCSCKDDLVITDSYRQWLTPPSSTGCRPSFHYDWDTSSNSINDPMVDSGKASDISVSSWPAEPIPWTPFPILHQLSRQRPPKTRRPHSYCEGTELVNLERSWTA